MPADFYTVLGTADDASEAELRSAYRSRVREFHPDVNDGPDADAQFKLVRKAHDVLSSPVERKTYDRIGHRDYVARNFDSLPALSVFSHIDESDAPGTAASSVSDGATSAGRSRNGSTGGTPGGSSSAGREGSTSSGGATDRTGTSSTPTDSKSTGSTSAAGRSAGASRRNGRSSATGSTSGASRTSSSASNASTTNSSSGSAPSERGTSSSDSQSDAGAARSTASATAGTSSTGTTRQTSADETATAARSSVTNEKPSHVGDQFTREEAERSVADRMQANEQTASARQRRRRGLKRGYGAVVLSLLAYLGGVGAYAVQHLGTLQMLAAQVTTAPVPTLTAAGSLPSPTVFALSPVVARAPTLGATLLAGVVLLPLVLGVTVARFGRGTAWLYTLGSAGPALTLAVWSLVPVPLWLAVVALGVVPVLGAGAFLLDVGRYLSATRT